MPPLRVSRLDGLKEKREMLVGFSEKMFHRLVDYVIVYFVAGLCLFFIMECKSMRKYKSNV